jgi:hypothetical protein
MSIRRIYVCDRCGAEAPALDRGIINQNVPREWTRVGIGFSGPAVNRTYTYHLCPGCSGIHTEWLKPDTVTRLYEDFGGA